jgi:hypothetical protein
MHYETESEPKKVTFEGVKVPSVYDNSNKMHKTGELRKLKNHNQKLVDQKKSHKYF